MADKQMRVWTLLENTACREDLTAEHGLSLYIEVGDKKILFDAGQTDAFADNAQKMGIDLKQVDFAVLSHGHYDHGGGLLRFLEINDHAPVYLSKYAFELHFNGKGHYIGLNPQLRDSHRMIQVSEDLELAPGIRLCSGEGLTPLYPVEPYGLTVEGQPEDFRHELYLCIRQAGKSVCFSGCSHRGILNIVHWLNPDILIGGFHFKQVTDEEVLTRAAQRLMAYPTVYYTGHCTGAEQYAFLRERMGDRLHALSTGSGISI